MRHVFAPLLLALSLLVIPAVGQAPATIDADSEDVKTLNLQGRIGDLELVREGDELRVQHNGHTLSADEYLAMIEMQQARRDAGGPLFKLFNITTAFGILWVAVGLLGQVLFTGRMVVQWIVSEKEKRSIVPPIFWYMSLAGATMLMIYFIWRKDIVGVLGQSTGWFIYARNVALIRKTRITVTRTGPASDDAEDSTLAPGH
ncbi:MAG: lipid-A-disaccharide synthase N-terminal domain-containing protein [Planctomycetota bacterium]